jgi:hypothetical protein
MISGHTITSTGQAREYGGSTDPANGLTYQGISKSGSFFCQSVNIWSFRQGMPIASQHTGSLVIGKKEDKVRFFSIYFGKEK